MSPINVNPRMALMVLMFSIPPVATAHDPVFAPGPHTLFRGGTELHLGIDRERLDGSGKSEGALALAYGFTADWTVGVELEEGTAFRTKYRFWRDDQPRSQSALALLAGFAGGDEGDRSQLALAYGHESLRWYRWVAVGYQSSEGGSDMVRLDLVGGIRFRLRGYRDPDAVWMLELNGELPRGTGPERWFLSPGLMWTVRNFALKAGVQIPIDAGGDPRSPDYRARVEFEWHL